MTAGLKVGKKVNSSDRDALGKPEIVRTSQSVKLLASQIVTKHFSALGYFKVRAASFLLKYIYTA